MTQTFEGARRFSTDLIDGGMKSFSTLTDSAQAIAAKASDFSSKAFETSTALLEKLLRVNSFEQAIEIQTDHAKQSYESLVEQAARMGELYADMAKEAYKPFESIVAKAR